ncbi:MAG: hypothetical protein NVSMB4_05640 [Acidimicrobiales bacterium]
MIGARPSPPRYPGAPSGPSLGRLETACAPDRRAATALRVRGVWSCLRTLRATILRWLANPGAIAYTRTDLGRLDHQCGTGRGIRDAVILIVDDDPAITTLLKMSFELEGHVVMTAASGPEALELAREIHPAAMVVDVMMPDMDGLELVRRLRANDATANIPIVCCSARSLARDVEAGLAAGADDYLTKPLDPYELVQKIEQRVQLRLVE